MPESTTQIKGPATEAGRRLLGEWPWSGAAKTDMRALLLVIEAEAAAAERAAILAELPRHVVIGHDSITGDPWRYIPLADVLAILDARQP